MKTAKIYNVEMVDCPYPECGEAYIPLKEHKWIQEYEYPVVTCPECKKVFIIENKEADNGKTFRN